MGKIMECEHIVIKVEHPTSGSCRYMGYCKKYKEYCVNQCGKNKDTKSKK